MSEQNNEQLTNQMKALGQRLAVLLAVADIPDDQKQAWATIIPEMSFEQLDKLAKILSAKLPDEATEEFDEFMVQLKGVQKEHEAEVSEVESQALSELQGIEDEINAAK